MIEKVLEAYEARIVGRKTFAQKLSKMDKITKAVFWGVIISAIVLFICGFIIPKPALLVVMSVYGAVVYIVTLVLERIHRKKWESNIKEYNIELNLLAELLKEKDFDLYGKNKIKQLIYKYYQDIEKQETRKKNRSSDIKTFICTYIIPVIAFFAGRINITESSAAEWLAIGITIITVVVSGKYIGSSIIELMEMISWNQLEKEKHFVLILQDLLDRDFVIEQDDLIL